MRTLFFIRFAPFGHFLPFCVLFYATFGAQPVENEICTEEVKYPIILQTCEDMFCRVYITEWMTSETAFYGAYHGEEYQRHFLTAILVSWVGFILI